jgi:hypothetical protein
MSTENENQTQTSAAEARFLDALAAIIENASTPEAAEAQLILLRRLVLQGDIINSRIPAPLNITQIGGYINLLDTKAQPEMQAQMLAGILGVAGPNPPLGWFTTKPTLAMIPITNDRPESPAQPTIPTRIAIRSDFLPDITEALKIIHNQHCTLPLINTFQPLPPATPGTDTPTDPLPYLGRTVAIAPATALQDPQNDPIAVARPQGTTQDFQVVARALKPQSAIPPANWEAFQCDQTTCNVVPVLNAKYLPLNPILANAGFYPKTPKPKPENQNATAWAHYINITGLISGATTLATELALVHSAADISKSVFASRLNWVWNGQEFSPP